MEARKAADPLLELAVRKDRRIVTAPIIALNGHAGHVHAVEIDNSGKVLRVLCGYAKPEHILTGRFNELGITCDHCYRRRDCRDIRDGRAA